MVIPDIQEAIDLIEGGKPADALPLLKDLVAHMPTYAALYAFMAQAYEATERWDDARTAWQRAAFLMPNSPAVYEGLERVLTATAPASGEMNRLQMDLDLQAELDAALDAALEPPYNPFMLPPQHEEEPATERPGAAPEEPVQEVESEAATIYDEIEQLITQRRIEEKATPPEAGDEDAGDESTPDATDAPVDSASDWVASRVAEVRKALAFEAQAEQDAKTPEAPEPAGTLEDLDRLISELESARIVPTPDLEDETPLDLEDEIDDMVSETMARIYASQEHFLEAARVYEQLARQQPEQAETYLRQAARMRARATGLEDPANPDDDAA